MISVQQFSAVAFSGLLPIQPCTVSGVLGGIGAGPTVTGTARTVTVPGGNSGVLRVSGHAVTGTVTFEYRINAGAFTDCLTDPTTLTAVVDGDTIQFRIGSATSGEDLACNLVDVTTGDTITTINFSVP